MLTLLVMGGLFFFGSGFLIITMKAFRSSIAWGLSCLLLPPVIIPYMVTHPKESPKPVILMLVGTAFNVLASFVSMTYGPS